MGYISNQNSLKLAVSSGWTDKIIATKYNKDNFVLKKVKKYKALGHYYNNRLFFKGTKFKQYMFRKILSLNFYKILWYKNVFTDTVPSETPHMQMIKRFEFTKSKILRKYYETIKEAKKNELEKIYSGSTIDLKNNKTILNINQIHFFGYALFYKYFLNCFKLNLDLGKRIQASQQIVYSTLEFRKYYLKKIWSILNYDSLRVEKDKLKKFVFRFFLKLTKLDVKNKNLIKFLITLVRALFRSRKYTKPLIDFFNKKAEEKKYGFDFKTLDMLMNLKTKYLTFNSRRILEIFNKFILIREKHLLKYKKRAQMVIKKYKKINRKLRIKVNQIHYLQLNSMMLSVYVMKKLAKNYSVSSIFIPLMKELKKHPTINGFRIRCKGRFIKTPKVKAKKFKFNKIKYNNFENFVSYTFDSIPLKYGASSVKLWVGFRTLKFYKNCKIKKIQKRNEDLKKIKLINWI